MADSVSDARETKRESVTDASAFPTPENLSNLSAEDNQVVLDSRAATTSPAALDEFGNDEFGQVSIEDPVTAPDRSDHNIIQGAPETQHSGWTVAIDLAANLTPEDSEHTYGAQPHLERLMEFAAQTAGTDLQIVVQATDADLSLAQLNAGETPNLERYVIRDGQIYQTYNGPSDGMQQDLANLLSEANKYAPSDNVGLVIQSHGGGDRGVSGDAGDMTLPELTDTIEASLKESGHHKLALLDFNACIMGHVNVMDAVKNVAEHVIASQEVEEACTPEVDGQNLPEILQRAADNPSMTPSDFGSIIMDVAQEGLNGEVPEEGQHGGPDRICVATPTLSHYDSSKEEAFNSAINTLGTELAEAVADPSNREAVAADISDATQVPSGPHIPSDQHRDVGQFLDRLQASIADGEITDPNGELAASLTNAQTALNAFVVDYHGQGEGYDGLGISIYMPDDRGLDPDAQPGANPEMWLESLSRLPEMIERLSTTDPAKANEMAANFHKGMGFQLTRLGELLPADNQDAIVPIVEAVANYEGADASNYRERLRNLEDAITTFLATPDGKAAMAAASEQAVGQLRDTIDQHVPNSYSGWESFIQAMV